MADGRWPTPSQIPEALNSRIADLLRRALNEPLEEQGRPQPDEWVMALLDTYVPSGRFDGHALAVLDNISKPSPMPTPSEFVTLPDTDWMSRPRYSVGADAEMGSTSELFPIFPIFLLIDVSASMAGGPIEELNAALPMLQTEMLSNPTVGGIARISVVTFSDEGRTVVPLCDLASAKIPEIMIEGGTNFASGFRALKEAIESGMASLPIGTPVYRPVAFFMSDGEHGGHEDWTVALDQVRDKSWKYAPEIVSFGFGAANPEAIRRVATRFAFLSKNMEPVLQVREIFRALIGSIRMASSSFPAPNVAEDLQLEAPNEFFTPLPPLEL